MSIFNVSKCENCIPDNCKKVIDGYAKKGMFDIKQILDGDRLTFYFLLTQDCNGKCPYCYQPEEFRQKITMTKELVDDAMDFIFDNFSEKKIKFSLFGGEPTMNMPLVKYMVESYPQFQFVVTTNGLRFIKDKETVEWFKNQHNINLSISINAPKYIYGEEGYLDYIEPCLDVVKTMGGDVHYVVDNPENPTTLSEIKYMFEYGIPTVRISSARHWDLVKNKTDEFIKLFKQVADYIYFDREVPMIRRSPWDSAFRGNLYKYLKGHELTNVPPTFCGCGYLYIAIDSNGDMYPCDFFANFPEFKMGDIYNGFQETSTFFKGMTEWREGLYDDCKNCTVVDDGDIRLCPRAMCLAENYVVNKNPLKPAENHCYANKIEYELFKYIAQRGIETGVDKYFGGMK